MEQLTRSELVNCSVGSFFRDNPFMCAVFLDFNPPVFTKQPADIRMDKKFQIWASIKSFKGGIAGFQASNDMKENCDFQFILSCTATNVIKYFFTFIVYEHKNILVFIRIFLF